MDGFREEVLNVALARILSRRGLVSVPETIARTLHGARKMPDVLVFFRGLRVVLEGKYSDFPNADARVSGDVREKIDEGVGHIGIAVVYPAELRGVEFNVLEDELEQARLRFWVYSENGERPWTQGDVNLLTSVLLQVYQEMIREDVVMWGTETLAGAIDRLSGVILALPVGGARVLRALEMQDLEEEGDGESNSGEA